MDHVYIASIEQVPLLDITEVHYFPERYVMVMIADPMDGDLPSEDPLSELSELRSWIMTDVDHGLMEDLVAQIEESANQQFLLDGFADGGAFRFVREDIQELVLDEYDLHAPGSLFSESLEPLRIF